MKRSSQFLVASSILIGLLGVSKHTEALSIKNQSDYTYRSMSVSSWANGGSTRIFDTKPGEWEKWDRTASRGVLLVNHNDNKTYYVDSSLSGYFQDDNVLRGNGRTIHPINTDVPSGNCREISVKNQTGRRLKISISKWDSHDDGAYYTVESGYSEYWRRTDYRGYIMVIDKDGQLASYYIKPGSQIIISAFDGPLIDGKRVSQITLQK